MTDLFIVPPNTRHRRRSSSKSFCGLDLQSHHLTASDRLTTCVECLRRVVVIRQEQLNRIHDRLLKRIEREEDAREYKIKP